MPPNTVGDSGADVVSPPDDDQTAEVFTSSGPKRPPRRGRDRTLVNGTTEDGHRDNQVRSADPVTSEGAGPTVKEPPTGFMAATGLQRAVESDGAPEPSVKPVQRNRARTSHGEMERTTRGRQGRRVTRVVRRIELWSVLKLALVLFTCLYAAVLGTLIVVWGVAYSSGQIERLQEFLADVGLENYRFYGDRMFRAVAAIGAIAVLAGSILAVLTTALVNLISEMTGGIRVVVIEEERRRR